MQKIHDQAALAALADSTNQPDSRVRLAVVEAVGKFYRDETPELLRNLLAGEKNPAIQAAALRGLGRFGDEESCRAVGRHLHTRSFRNELAGAAITAIQMRDDPADRAVLLKLLSTGQGDFTSRGYSRALVTLARLSRKEDNNTQVRRLLNRHLNHPKERIRIGAIQALGALGDRRSAAVLQTLADQQSGDRVATAAAAALKQLQAKSALVPEEVTQLRKAVSELRKENDKLRKDVDEVKARLDAKAAP